MTKPIHPDIPTDRAWKEGRRIYIKAGYKSQLNTELRDLGAKWDADQKALWVGSTKADQVVPLVQAAAARAARAEQTKSGGHWVKIPYAATDIRDRAKKLGAAFDGDRKEWALPSAEAQAEIDALLAKRATKLAEQTAAERQERAESAESAAERIIAVSGRTVVGERGTAEVRLRGRMRRPQAEQAAPKPGDVRRVNGQRVLVLSTRVDFVSQDAIDDGVWGDPSYEPGWYCTYKFAPVDATEQERKADEKEAARKADEQEIDAVFRAARKAAQPVDTTPADGPHIVTDTGSMGTHDGKLTLTEDGLWWYHPGYYDDWQRVNGRVDDPDLVDRVRAILAGGLRVRGRYEVRP